MLTLRALDCAVAIEHQLQDPTTHPIVLINLFTVAEADIPALLAAWEADGNWMKSQSGFISA